MVVDFGRGSREPKIINIMSNLMLFLFVSLLLLFKFIKSNSEKEKKTQRVYLYIFTTEISRARTLQITIQN
jgi:hypothetical protein